MTTTRVLFMCPYLPLRRPVEFGTWWLGPVDTYAGAWESAAFHDQARALIEKFRDGANRPIGKPSLLAHRRDGATGASISRGEFQALQLALHVSALDANPVWTHDGEMWRWASSDNSELYGWPINLSTGGVTLMTGGLLRTMSGGWRVTDADFSVRPPLELHMPAPLSLDAEVIDACYEVLRHPDRTLEPELARRVAQTIPWLERAWRNTPSIAMHDRIVMLKTGFETLLGTDKVEPAMGAIRALFERLTARGASRFNTQHLLWRAGERVNLKINVGRNSQRVLTVTPLQHWFANFTFLRNAIIHGQKVGRGISHSSSARYRGPHFHIGERALREAIRASVALCSDRDIWKSLSDRELEHVIARLESDAGGIP